MSLSPPSATSGLDQYPLSSASTATRIRAIFVNTWNEFYIWSPPIYASLHSSHIAQPDNPDEDPAVAFFNHLDALPFDQASTKPNTARLPRHKLVGKLETRRVTLEADNYLAAPTAKKLIPKYSFCIAQRERIKVATVHACPFVPLLGDDVDFEDETYFRHFPAGLAGWSADRDGSVDIICVEALRRIRALNLDDAAIDSTRILPFPCSTIDVLDVTRDLPPFPTPMQVLETYVEEEPSDRKWNAPYAVPPEADDPGHSRADMEELFCRVQSCKTFGCAGHVGDGKDQAITPPRPISQAIPPFSDRAARACSLTCHRLIGPDREELRSWTTWERNKLRLATQGGYVSACDIARSFTSRSCNEIAAEIQLLGRQGPRVRGRLSREETHRRDGCGWIPQKRLRLTVRTSTVAGYGLFADDDIDAGQVLGDYPGEQIEPIEADKRDYLHKAVKRNYLFEQTDGAIIDAANQGGLIRFVNGCSEHDKRRNCEPVAKLFGDDRLTLVTTKKVRRGEELFFNYGQSFVHYHQIEGTTRKRP